MSCNGVVRSKFRKKRPNDSKGDKSGQIVFSLTILFFSVMKESRLKTKDEIKQAI